MDGLISTKCGLDCSECDFRENCGSCVETGKNCMIASCCESKGHEKCENFFDPNGKCSLRDELISEFNALGIEDMKEVISLNALKGSFVNLEYTLPGG